MAHYTLVNNDGRSSELFEKNVEASHDDARRLARQPLDAAPKLHDAMVMKRGLDTAILSRPN
ncbi:hypothetical protein [Brevundimonas sp.]|uniref:hypothetical protein n=1 Tax=Brevundimonas sp. TaxID=1871086 RepID=UPI0037BE8362